MKSVNVAELKNKLSAYLDEVERGEEFVVKNRKKVVARIIPVNSITIMEDEWMLVTEGKLRLPAKGVSKKYLERFLAVKMPPVSAGTSVEALARDRNEK